MIEQPPELADGGYWYVVATETIVENGRNTIRPVIPNATGWCAWYNSDNTQAVVRTPDPIVGVDTISSLAAQALLGQGFASHPLGRIGGR